jgi:hypothetical protein
MPTILATQEASIRKIAVQSQPRQTVHKTLSQKNPSKKRAGGVAQGVGPRATNKKTYNEMSLHIH